MREISPLTDANAARSIVGLPLNMAGFDSLLLSQFHDLPIVGPREAASTIYVMTERPISAEAKETVTEFIRDIRLPIFVDFEIGMPAEPAKPPPPLGSAAIQDDALLIRPAGRRPHAPDFVRKDETFWFDHLRDAATGTPALSRFPGIRPDHYRCYLDLTVGEHVNLRQALPSTTKCFVACPWKTNTENSSENRG